MRAANDMTSIPSVYNYPHDLRPAFIQMDDDGGAYVDWVVWKNSEDNFTDRVRFNSVYAAVRACKLAKRMAVFFDGHKYWQVA